MQSSCEDCGLLFEIPSDDLTFFEEVSPVIDGKKELIPPPKFCPDCRNRRRLLFRNDLNLYHRKSSLTGKQIMSIYSPEKPYLVYDQDEWWSDRWNELDYGRDFDFSRTFSEQFLELGLLVPHQSLFTTNVENSYYTNHTLNARNCYLISGGTNIENCLFGRFIITGNDNVDGLSLYSCEWCYEGIASELCYQCFYFMNCRNCSDCILVEDSESCRNCCMCFGLKNKEYCFLNQPLGPDEYRKKIASLFLLSRSKVKELKRQFADFKKTLPHRGSHIFMSEDCTGDMVFSSKNCHYAFDCTDCEDCSYLWNTPKGRFSRDGIYTAPDGIEWCYNVGSTVGVNRAMATFLLWYGNDVYYSRECHRSSNLFGCVGMRHKQYCILNKHYSKEQYESLVPRIIEHMRKTGEWGSYLAPELSFMGYNESLGYEYYPLERNEVLKRGWNWFDEKTAKSVIPEKETVIPENINVTDESICDQILLCRVSRKPFKILPQELVFYKRMGLPVPDLCPAERHKDRLKLRNPRKLWSRKCAGCGNYFETNFASERSENVLCENCYLKQKY